MILPEIRHIFHEVLIDCMSNNRAPTPDEVEAVAERIWRDINGARSPRGWDELPLAAPERRQAFLASRVALGLDIAGATRLREESLGPDR